MPTRWAAIRSSTRVSTPSTCCNIAAIVFPPLVWGVSPLIYTARYAVTFTEKPWPDPSSCSVLSSVSPKGVVQPAVLDCDLQVPFGSQRL